MLAKSNSPNLEDRKQRLKAEIHSRVLARQSDSLLVLQVSVLEIPKAESSVISECRPTFY